MDLGFIALLIPLAPFMLGGFAIWAHHQRKMLDKQAEISRGRADENAARNAQLEQRVATLERIITDKSNSLSDEIESLRETPLN